MIHLVDISTDTAIAKELLEEYVADRLRTRPASASDYRAPRPHPSQFIAPAGRFVIAYDEDAALGCAGIRSIQPGREFVDNGFGGSRWYELKHLYTRPTARGRGIGQIIMASLSESAKVFGGDRLVLDTHSSLDSAARLYTKLGFVEIPRFNDNSNADRWLGKTL
ncbi:MAG: GNAT family N-acetyltransferase [Gulosibacter sp.]|uniref:GNAT family N-acetyltransferase n=1 Tax=Gulosibacter sp. TaxID=2817531 RepID=UPI003F8DF676